MCTFEQIYFNTVMQFKDMYIYNILTFYQGSPFHQLQKSSNLTITPSLSFLRHKYYRSENEWNQLKRVKPKEVQIHHLYSVVM